jgi:bifunctional non-homologous end joining protein LigD
LPVSTNSGVPCSGRSCAVEGVPCFVAFDLLWFDGRDLRELPLRGRKRRLRAVLRPAKECPVLYLQHVVGAGRNLFAYAEALDLEGIVAKVAASPYALVNGRSPWVKVKRRDYSRAVCREDLFTRRGG